MHAPPVLVITAEYEPPRKKDEFCAGRVNDSALTPSDGVNHGFMSVMTRTGGGCIFPSRAQQAPAQIAHHGFKVLQTRSESFPKAAEIGREIKFLTVYAGFGPS